MADLYGFILVPLQLFAVELQYFIQTDAISYGLSGESCGAYISPFNFAEICNCGSSLGR